LEDIRQTLSQEFCCYGYHNVTAELRGMDYINNLYGIKGVTIRNDNGSHFIANQVKAFLRSAQSKQKLTERGMIIWHSKQYPTETLKGFDNNNPRFQPGGNAPHTNPVSCLKCRPPDAVVLITSASAGYRVTTNIYLKKEKNKK